MRRPYLLSTTNLKNKHNKSNFTIKRTFKQITLKISNFPTKKNIVDKKIKTNSQKMENILVRIKNRHPNEMIQVTNKNDQFFKPT